jgi:hypothetical protein
MTSEAKVMTMALCLARQAVKERLRDCGIRTIEVEPSELRKATDVYLEVRRAELIEEAKAMLCR